MFFPYADDNPPEARVAWMNWLLIIINVLVFVNFGLSPNYQQTVLRYGFTPAYFRTETLFTSLFLHGGLGHLAGNMWFLYLFGDNVENRCGPLKYLACYILSGVTGDLCHWAFFPNSAIPSIGASGAIAGVMGMYLFFFPYNRVRVFLLLFIFIQRLSISAIWVIGLWFGMELLYSHMQTLQGGQGGGVGHLAHAGGLIAGFLLAAFMTMLGLVRNEGDHLFAVMTGRGRPRRSPYLDEERNAAFPGFGADAEFVRRPTLDVADPRVNIVALLHAGRIDEARRAWRKYAFDNHDGVLPAREQLEVALALDKQGERSAARDAYERLIKAYPNEQPYAAEANLALAGMLLQELKENGDQREVPLIAGLLRRVADSHPYPQRRALAEKWLQAISA
jgi:membrane associated rhomboid family serine protease